MERSELHRGLVSTLRALEPYRSELVLVGGWVPWIWFRFGPRPLPAARTSLTTEADLVLPRSLPAEGRAPLSRLLEDAGFRAVGETGVIWARDPGRGETVELLRTHRGPASRRGRPTGVAGQPGIRALSLEHLWILERFARALTVRHPEAAPEGLEVRVPTLAAFLLNKANTFSLRTGPDGRIKTAKDLLYLRDVMAAGPDARDLVDHDLLDMTVGDGDGRVRSYLDRAIVHIERVAPSHAGRAGAILAERDGVEPTAAEADVRGHLTDLGELLGASRRR